MRRHFCIKSVYTLAACLTLASSSLSAQVLLSGTVTDKNTGLAVTGAAVTIEAVNRSAITDRTGRYLIPNLPAGTYSVHFRYIGYQPLQQQIIVSNNLQESLNAELLPAHTQLGEVLIFGSRAGQASALNQQMNSANVTNVVAADQIGRFPDANIGDAMKRIPGITIGLDQGEARFGSIRGTEPRFNSVMINGERVPSAEAEVREVQLDLIPADMVQAIEVNKTLTPDMDADAIGGAVNVVTRAAPPGMRISATAGSGYNFIREKPVMVGSLVLGNRFLSDKLGVIVSGSYYDQKFGSDNKEGVWNKTENGTAYLEEFDLRRYDVQRTRRSITASFDWRFNDANRMMVRSIYNHRDDWENRFRLRYALDEPDADGIQTSELRRQTKGGGPNPRLKNSRLEDQKTQSHQLSGEHIIGRVSLDWSGSISRASETRPDERYIEWRSRNVDVRPDYTDIGNPYLTAVDPEKEMPSAFQFRRIEWQESYTKDEDKNAKVNISIPLSVSENSSKIKIGGRYRAKEKLRNNIFDRALPINGDEFASLALNPAENYSVSKNLSGDYSYGVFSTPEFLSSLPFNDASKFSLEDQPGDYVPGNFNANEKVSAGYAMLEQGFGERVSVIAGVRMEHTKLNYDGHEFDLDEETSKPTSGQKSYTNILPSVNVRWNASDKTIVRAAVTSTIARPNYYDLVPYRSVSLDDNELETGNPNLKPTQSLNIDVMLEHYFESVGLISAGLFHKDISDFVFSYTEFNKLDIVSGNVFSSISQPRNGASATLTGAEIAVQRRLDFLPGIFRNIGVYANYTFNSSGVSGLGIEGRNEESLPLLGTAKHSGNLSVSYDIPRLSLRAALNYQSESLDAGEGGYNEDAFFDRWADRRTDIDLNGNVFITPQIQLFVEANNLTNRPLRFYQGNRGRLMQDEFYGRRIQTGLKLDF